MEKLKKIVHRNCQKSRNLILKNWVDRFFLNFPETFLDTNVTDLLKKIGVTELIFEKNSKNCDNIFGYLVLPLFVIVVMETRLLSELLCVSLQL
jgi:hypothetical protein